MMIMIPATPRLSASTRGLVSGPMECENKDGMSMASTASTSRMALRLAPRLSKDCLPCRNPPTTKEKPMTSSRLPRIDPVMEALTSSSSPARMATMVMISSAALPRVAFSKPPMRGPV